MKTKTGTLSKKVSKVLIVLLVLLFSFAVLSAGFTAVFFSVFFGRADRIEPGELLYADLGKNAPPREAISFLSGDRLLAGYLYFPQNEPKGMIVIAAGIASGADSHLAETVRFLENGFAVFTFDGTGVRNSEGSGVIGLSQAKIDTRSALWALENDPRTNALPFLLYGHSVGGYACASLLSEAERVKAAVSIGAFSSPEETMLYYGRKKVGFLADLEAPFLMLQNRLLFGADADTSAIDAINESGKPVLVVEGSEDQTVPDQIAISASRARIINPNARFLTVSEPYRCGHSAAWLSADAARYRLSLAEGEPVDKARANELDDAFMEQVISFFEDAIQ